MKPNSKHQPANHAPFIYNVHTYTQIHTVFVYCVHCMIFQLCVFDVLCTLYLFLSFASPLHIYRSCAHTLSNGGIVTHKRSALIRFGVNMVWIAWFFLLGYIYIGHWVELQVRNDLRKQQHQARSNSKCSHTRPPPTNRWYKHTHREQERENEQEYSDERNGKRDQIAWILYAEKKKNVATAMQQKNLSSFLVVLFVCVWVKSAHTPTHV